MQNDEANREKVRYSVFQHIHELLIHPLGIQVSNEVSIDVRYTLEMSNRRFRVMHDDIFTVFYEKR